jgi:hypothetical protein
MNNGSLSRTIAKGDQVLKKGLIPAQALNPALRKMAVETATGKAFWARLTQFTAESNAGGTGGKKGGKRNYFTDVSAAAAAKKRYDDMAKAANDWSSDGTQVSKDDLLKSWNDYQSKLKVARRAATITKRGDDKFDTDFGKAYRNSSSPPPGAIPDAPAGGDAGAPVDAAPAAPAPDAQQAVPTAPPATSGGKPRPPALDAQFKAALAAGKSRDAMIQKLQANGYSTEGL